jgi:hypothetical protein
MNEPPEYLHGKKGLYFHQGKFFENSKDFWKDAEEWQYRIMDQETCERLMKSFSKDVQMNIFMAGLEIKNGEMLNIIESLFYQFIREICKDRK